MAVALDTADIFDGEGQVRVLGGDADLVRAVHQLLQRGHGPAHPLVIQGGAHIKIEVRKLLRGAMGGLGHGAGRIAQDDPACSGAPVFHQKLHLIVLIVQVHLRIGNTAFFKSVFRVTDADVAVHFVHAVRLQAVEQVHLLLGAALHQCPVQIGEFDAQEGQPLGCVYLPDQVCHKGLVNAPGLDQYPLAGLDVQGKPHQIVGQFCCSLILYHVLLLLKF